MSKRRLHLLWFALLAFGLVVAACGSDQRNAQTPTTGGAGDPRTFAMGLSSLPAELTEESYASAFERAAAAGEVILIQRVPPWEELLADGMFPSDDIVLETQRETALAEEHDLDLFVAIDPMDASAGAGQLAGTPGELRGAGFADEGVRAAFILYAQYLALNYKPKYLALGVEVNAHQGQNPEDFEQFVSLYAEAYDAVKELSPETLVFPTFQLEELKGRLPVGGVGKPQWHLVDRFEPRMDLLAVSSYPGLVFPDPTQIPEGYYTDLGSKTAHPVAIAETGYPSGAGVNGTAKSSEQEQASFVRRVLRDAEELQAPLLVWFVGQDPSFTGDPPMDVLQDIGLLRQDGREKAAWSVWTAAAARTLEETGSAQAPER